MKDLHDIEDKDTDYYFQVKDDIKSFEDLNKFLARLNLLYSSNKSFIFRGESNYSGKLQPKLFRKSKINDSYFINSYDNINNISWADTEYEKLVLRMFISIKKLYETFDDMGRYDFPDELNKFDTRKVISKTEINDIILKNSKHIGFAQHHGLPTLALDFSFDFKTALYFSLTGDYTEEDDWACKWVKNNSCLWVMDLSIFQKEMHTKGYLNHLINSNLSYKDNKNAYCQKALSILCLDTYKDGINNLEDFCVFEKLRENCEINDEGIRANGNYFMGIYEPLVYKILIPPNLKIEIVKEMDYFRNFNVWHSNNKIIEKMKISRKLFEICNVDRLHKINSNRPSLDEIFCKN